MKHYFKSVLAFALGLILVIGLIVGLLLTALGLIELFVPSAGVVKLIVGFLISVLFGGGLVEYLNMLSK